MVNFLFIMWSVVCIYLVIALVVGAMRTMFPRRGKHDAP